MTHTITQDTRQLITLHEKECLTKVFVVEEGAHLQLDVIIVGDPSGEIALIMPVTLAGVGASADVRVLGLAQSSRIRIAASMQIASGAQQTDGQLSMRGLLLDDDAAISMTPGLNVAANDVSAGHGASIDRVDPRERFYLESRGLSSSDAQRMIRSGMVRDMIADHDTSLLQDSHAMDDLVANLL